MKIEFRITRRLLVSIRADLRRPHDFADERIGFVYCRFGKAPPSSLIVLAYAYEAVQDGNYLDDPNFGAVIDSGAFRYALTRSLREAVGVFHVHLHEHQGIPTPSGADIRETAKFVPDFFNARPSLPHGALILSSDRLSVRIWMRKQSRPVPIDRATVVGAPRSSFGSIR